MNPKEPSKIKVFNLKKPTYTSIDLSLLNQVSEQAATSTRTRMNYNFHQLEDRVQRFLNAIEPGSYVQPHRHKEPLRDESFVILRGRGSVFIFDDQGNIQDCIILNSEAGSLGIDIPGGVFHSILSLEKGSVFFEVKPGPYIPIADKDFASWAPKENTAEAILFLKNLEKIALSQL